MISNENEIECMRYDSPNDKWVKVEEEFRTIEK